MDSFRDNMDTVKKYLNDMTGDKLNYIKEFINDGELADFVTPCMIIVLFAILFLRVIKIGLRVEIFGLRVEFDAGFLATLAAFWIVWREGGNETEDDKKQDTHGKYW